MVCSDQILLDGMYETGVKTTYTQAGAGEPCSREADRCAKSNAGLVLGRSQSSQRLLALPVNPAMRLLAARHFETE